MTGKIDGQQAFVQGKLKIQGALLHIDPSHSSAGNMALAMKLSVLRQQKAKL